ncbi:class III signal peptide-containing protein [Candidatus Parvarchaeota archaeon]|nr:class III signal peptide-containing protein [Candidatus Parvarchaeota archaeon]
MGGTTRGKKGQLSAEMLILLAVILAVVLLVANSMLSAGKTASSVASGSANKTFEEICRSTGTCTACTTDSDCSGIQSGRCINSVCQ